MRGVLQFIVGLLAGPPIAFWSVFMGCDGPAPLLGRICTYDMPVVLLGATFAVCLLLVVAVSWLVPGKKNEHATHRKPS